MLTHLVLARAQFIAPQRGPLGGGWRLLFRLPRR